MPPFFRHLHAAVILALGLAVLPAAGPLLAQSLTEAKIRLMADALRARDSGDLELAQRNLLELAELAPEDPSVKRLLGEVQDALGAERERLQMDVEPAVVTPAPAPAPTGNWEDPFTAPPAAQPDPMAQLAAMEAEIEAAAAEEEARQLDLITDARSQAFEAEAMVAEGRYDAAVARLDAAIWSLPENPMTAPVIADLKAQRTDTLEARKAAQTAASDQAPPPVVERSATTVTVSGGETESELDELWARARSAYTTGRWEEAREAVDEILLIDPGNNAARRLAQRIDDEWETDSLMWRRETRRSLISEVEQSWRRPEVAVAAPDEIGVGLGGNNALQQKLASIQIPSVSFTGVELQRVVSTLSDLSREFDPGAGGPPGVNIIVIDPQSRQPTVSLTLRDLSLKRVLDFITDSIGYQYEVQADAVVLRPGGETSTLDTEFFPITRSTVIRMTGIGGGLASGGSGPAVDDPFSPAPAQAVSAPGGGSEAEALKQFLQQAGVDFANQPGANLAYDGSAMIVTQTSRNIERIRNILNRYNDVRQVEIEAKFMEVQEGALEEFGISWNVVHGLNGDPSYLATGESSNRTLASAFSPNATGTSGQITSPDIAGTVTDPITGEIRRFIQPGLDVPIPNNPPGFPGTVNLGEGSNPLLDISGMIGEFNVNAVVQALSQKTGSDLLSAPKITVLSGNPATITVAQELRYPTSYGEVRSEVGSSSRDSSSAGVTITAGTPQDFEMRKVGVELRVTPTVEEDDYSISLDLNPRVTEFEGFVEYGGQSVAISNNTTVTVPSGFYQPIFSTREVSTKVTLWDGATLVMGGLTREEIKTIEDKVPFLGDIPGLGRLFRSEGETTQKRNLLIFVTANLVSPGGSPKKQSLPGIAPSSPYQNPSLVTPGGSVERE
jgi:general secretion pathway protein D